MVYRRLQWVVETQFLLPEFQAGFRSSRSCADNLVILTNQIHLAFMNKSPLIAVFLDVAGAFDNVIPSILTHDLRTIGFPARICKFVENLLSERFIRFVWNDELSEPRIVHKGTPQGSILSPFFLIFTWEKYLLVYILILIFYSMQTILFCTHGTPTPLSRTSQYLLHYRQFVNILASEG